MRYLIGIDDTDNLESRGTGHRVRQLAQFLDGLAEPVGITRHQLLVAPEIPYTSHNSSACLVVEVDPSSESELWVVCREFLLRESAPGSDAGLCLASWEAVSACNCIQTFGSLAKIAILTQVEAEQIGQEHKLRLEGLTGTGGGVIGALAAVGLHQAGNDGRFLWLPGLRELSGILSVAEICARGHIDCVRPLEGADLAPETLVNLGEWMRPILRGGQAVLYVEEQNDEWHILSKDQIKNLSN